MEFTLKIPWNNILFPYITLDSMTEIIKKLYIQHIYNIFNTQTYT